MKEKMNKLLILLVNEQKLYEKVVKSQELPKCSSRKDVTPLCQTAHEFILIYYTVVESQNVPKKEFQALN